MTAIKLDRKAYVQIWINYKICNLEGESGKHVRGGLNRRGENGPWNTNNIVTLHCTLNVREIHFHWKILLIPGWGTK